MPDLRSLAGRAVHIVLCVSIACTLLTQLLHIQDAIPSPLAKLDDTTLMVTVTDSEASKVALRISLIHSHTGFALAGNRFFVVDARRSAGAVSDHLQKEMQEIIDIGYMDGVIVFNESPAEAEARDRRWGADGLFSWDKGNAIYYFMLENCTTRYLAHSDLDIIGWNRPGRSWVHDAHYFLREHNWWYVSPPRPWYFHGAFQYDLLFCAHALARLFFTFAPRGHSDRNPDYGSSRIYLADTLAWRHMEKDATRFPQVSYSYQTDHWENTSSMLARSLHRNYGYMMDCTSYWILHADDTRMQDHRSGVDNVLFEAAQQGVSLSERHLPFKVEDSEPRLERRQSMLAEIRASMWRSELARSLAAIVVCVSWIFFLHPSAKAAEPFSALTARQDATNV